MSTKTFAMHLYVKERLTFDKELNQVRTLDYHLHPFGDSDYMGSYVGPVDVQCEVPDNFDIRAAKLRDLQTEQQKVRAEMTKRITELQRQINELQAIDMETVTS